MSQRESDWSDVLRGLCDVRAYQVVCNEAASCCSPAPHLDALDAALAHLAAGRHVLHVGARAGLVALMARKHGAVGVVSAAATQSEAACASAVLSRNGACEPEFRVTHSPCIASLTPEKVGARDVGLIVADVLGEYGGAAGALGSGVLAGLLSSAAAVPSAAVVPRRVRVVAQGAEVALPPRVSGTDLRLFNAYQWDVGACSFPADELRFRPLTREFEVGTVCAGAAQRSEHSLVVSSAGDLTAFVFWLEVEMEEGAASVRTRAGSLFWARPAALTVRDGETIHVAAKLSATSVFFKILGHEDVLRKPELIRPAIEMWHYTMLADAMRNDAYEQGIIRAINQQRSSDCPRPLVLEIGAGTGLLSMMAARQDAQVVAVEQSGHMANCARKIVETNGFAESITVLDKHSRDVSVGEGLPEKPNVVVFEIFDYTLLGEGVLPTIRDLHERGLIDKSTTLVPYAATVFGMLLEAPNFKNVRGFDLSDVTAFRRVHPEVGWDGAQVRQGTNKQLTGVFRSFRFDFRDKESVQAELPTHQFIIEVQQDGELNAIAFWFHLHVDPEITVNTLFTSAWVQGIQYFSDPLRVTRGEKLQVLAWVFQDAQLMFAVGKADGGNTGPAGGPSIVELPRWCTGLRAANERLASFAESHKAVPGSKSSREDLEILARLTKDAPTHGIDRHTAQVAFRRTLAASWPLEK